jgi:heat shock protein HtpX
MRFFEHQRRARNQSRKLTVLFVALIVGQVVLMNLVLAIATILVTSALRYFADGVFAPSTTLLPKYFIQTNTALVLFYIFGGWWIESSNLTEGGAKLAQGAGARWIGGSGDRVEDQGAQSSNQQLFNIVQELSLASNMLAPRVYVMPRHEGINAFAAGWDETDSVICVTQGALDCLEREELMGLIAHELSHIREGDTRLNMRLAGMVLGLELLYNLGQSLAFHELLVLRLIGYILLGPGWLNWLCARLMKAAISREREFLADARAVQFTRNKEGLGRTLRKILWQQEEGSASQITHPAVQHMLLVDDNLQVQTWLQSHPSLDDRVQRIYGRAMPKVEALARGRKLWRNPFASD